mgnify:CR=1 FL=1
MLNRLWHNHLLALFLLFVVVASGGDLLADLSEGVNTYHLVQEGLILALAICALVWLFIERQQAKQQLHDLHLELSEIKNRPELASTAVAEAKHRLAEVIAQQLQEWALTTSEKEIAQLLLKGFSLKEIAALRGTAEKTIRQQASAIYKKSGVSGRHSFSAWFMEDFL